MTVKRIAIAAGAVLALSQPVLATPVDDYLHAQTAVEINRLCGGFKSVEHRALVMIVDERRGLTGWYDDSADVESYWAVVEDHDGMARQRAVEMGCGEEAQMHLLSYLQAAMGRVFGDLFMAFHFASLPADDINHFTLNADEMAAAQRYDAYLQQRFGGNFPTFSAQVREQASALIVQATPAEDPFNPFGSYLDDGYTSMDPTDLSLGFGAQSNWEMMRLLGQARWTLDMVLLEVVTEMAGRQLIERASDGVAYTDVVNATTGAVEMKIWSGPTGAFMQGFTNNYFLALTDTGALKFVTWSQGAARSLGQSGTVAFYVNTTPMPADVATPIDYYQSETWLDGAERFNATLVQDCFGEGVCYEFAPADVARILEVTSTPRVEMVLSPLAKVESRPRSESGFRYGDLDITALSDLIKDWPPRP